MLAIYFALGKAAAQRKDPSGIPLRLWLFSIWVAMFWSAAKRKTNLVARIKKD
jgi:hypothetical protein